MEKGFQGDLIDKALLIKTQDSDMLFFRIYVDDVFSVLLMFLLARNFWSYE